MTTREEKKTALKEGIKNSLEELWDAEEEELFYKIFTRECQHGKGTQKFMRYSKVEIQDLSCGDDDRTLHFLRKHKAGYACMLVH